MKATEFPYEKLNEAAHASEAFVFYQSIDDKDWIYWKIPYLTMYGLTRIKEIINETYFGISAEDNTITISFLLIN